MKATVKIVAAALGVLAIGGLPSLAGEAKPAYFSVTNGNPEEAFMIALTDEAKIAEARAIVSGKETRRIHVHGTVVAAKAPYNSGWSFHLDPDTVDFFEMAAEVCDASTSYVETHLNDVGGAFLPGGHWCPWFSKVSAEVNAGPAPQRE